jgi:hypothetical protein
VVAVALCVAPGLARAQGGAPSPELPSGQTAPARTGALLIVADVAGAEVYVDGTRYEDAPATVTSLEEGPHFVEVRRASLPTQRLVVRVLAGQTVRVEVQLLEPPAAAPAQLSAPHAAPPAAAPPAAAPPPVAPAQAAPAAPSPSGAVSTGRLRVRSNVRGAEVVVDGTIVGRTPLEGAHLAAGMHAVEVRMTGYAPAQLAVRVEPGRDKTLEAELVPLRLAGEPPPRGQAVAVAAPPERLGRLSSSFSAIAIEPGRFTVDLAGGFFPFGEVRMTVGAWRRRSLGLDAGVGVGTNFYQTVATLHARFQWLEAGPLAIGVDTRIGGGGGPLYRNTVEFDLGLPLTLAAGNLVRFTLRPTLQVYSDRNCPSVEAVVRDPGLLGPGGEEPTCRVSDVRSGGVVSDTDRQVDAATRAAAGGQDPRLRFTSARLLLRAALEISVHRSASIFFVVEGDPVGQRQAFTQKYAAIYLFTQDPQIYGRAGVTFKF